MAVPASIVVFAGEAVDSMVPGGDKLDRADVASEVVLVLILPCHFFFVFCLFVCLFGYGRGIMEGRWTSGRGAGLRIFILAGDIVPCANRGWGGEIDRGACEATAPVR